MTHKINSTKTFHQFKAKLRKITTAGFTQETKMWLTIWFQLLIVFQHNAKNATLVSFLLHFNSADMLIVMPVSLLEQVACLCMLIRHKHSLLKAQCVKNWKFTMHPCNLPIFYYQILLSVKIIFIYYNHFFQPAYYNYPLITKTISLI